MLSLSVTYLTVHKRIEPKWNCTHNVDDIRCERRDCYLCVCVLRLFYYKNCVVCSAFVSIAMVLLVQWIGWMSDKNSIHFRGSERNQKKKRNEFTFTKKIRIRINEIINNIMRHSLSSIKVFIPFCVCLCICWVWFVAPWSVSDIEDLRYDNYRNSVSIQCVRWRSVRIIFRRMLIFGTFFEFGVNFFRFDPFPFFSAQKYIFHGFSLMIFVQKYYRKKKYYVICAKTSDKYNN